MSIIRVAVMVDGDNVSPVHAAHILSEAAKLGRIDVARVYVSGTQPTDWLSMAGYRAMHSGAGKNSADILLSIDAMELALRSETKGFVVATSDGDFSHLAHRLREHGLHVLGLGEAKAPKSFRLACSKFEVLKDCKPTESQCEVQSLPARFSKFDSDIRDMIALHSKGSKGMRIVDLGPKMSFTHGTRIGQTPEKTWRAYLTKRPILFDVDPRDSEAMVRFRMGGFAAQ